MQLSVYNTDSKQILFYVCCMEACYYPVTLYLYISCAVSKGLSNDCQLFIHIRWSRWRRTAISKVKEYYLKTL